MKIIKYGSLSGRYIIQRTGAEVRKEKMSDDEKKL